MAPFYGWGSTTSRLKSLWESVYFLPLSSQNFLVLIDLGRMKDRVDLGAISGFEHGTP